MATRDEKMALLDIMKTLSDAQEAARWLDEEQTAKANVAQRPRRLIQAFVGGLWVNAQAQELAPGLLIRMFEPDGTEVLWMGKNTAKVESVEPMAEDGTSGIFILVEQP